MKQIYLINAINKELSKIVEYYESVTTKHIMVIGSAALSLRGIPIIPEDIDIVVPVSLDANPPKIEINIASKNLISNNFHVSLTLLEDKLPFFSHPGKTFSLSDCYAYSETIYLNNGVTYLLPPLGVLLLLAIKKVDDAFTLAKAGYLATEDSNNADKLLYRTLLTIEKILLNYSKNESKLLLLHCKEIKLDWYIPDIPRILLIVQEFLNIQNNTNKYKVLDHIQYLLSIVNHRQHSTVTVDIENVIEESINKTAPLTIFSRPSGFYIQFKRSGNVYHTISENDVKGLAQEINSQIINALTDIRIVHFQITNQCHLRCKHCLYYHGTGNMKLNTITDLLDQFSKSGICEVDFGEGGEATLHPALSKIICYTVEKCKMIPNLTTNLLCLLSDELVDVLSQCAGSVTLSLDNYHYPAFAKRGIPINIDNNLKKLRDKQINPAINYVYEHSNLNQIVPDIKWLLDKGFTKITLLRKFESSFNKQLELPSNDGIDALLSFLSTVNIEVGFASCDPLLEHPLISRVITNMGLAAGAECKATKEFVFVDIKGNVRPCGFCPPSMSVKSSSFPKSITTLQNMFDDYKTRNILSCPFRKTKERR